MCAKVGPTSAKPTHEVHCTIARSWFANLGEDRLGGTLPSPPRQPVHECCEYQAASLDRSIFLALTLGPGQWGSCRDPNPTGPPSDSPRSSFLVATRPRLPDWACRTRQSTAGQWLDLSATTRPTYLHSYIAKAVQPLAKQAWLVTDRVWPPQVVHD